MPFWLGMTSRKAWRRLVHYQNEDRVLFKTAIKIRMITNMDDRIARIEALRNGMKEKKIDYYLIPTSDFHNSEYVGDYFKVREYYSGFTGSNGTLLVGPDMAGLWTDGRYFVQADKELSGSGITLFKMGEEGVPTITEYIKEHGKKGCRIGFDGRILRKNYVEKMLLTCKELEPVLVCEEDVAGKLWEDRPAISAEIVTVMEEQYRGEETDSKWEKVIEKMHQAEADFLFVSKLDDIMWFLNVRGNDVECNPVALSYLYITEKEIHVFLQKEAVTEELRSYLEARQVDVHEYRGVFAFLETQTSGLKGIADGDESSYLAAQSILKNGVILDVQNPIEAMKAVKDEKELAHIREFYLKDSVAVCKFLYRMKKEGHLYNEYSAGQVMDALRAQIPGFQGLSFPTICAYGENAAMMHYEATKDSHAMIEGRSFLLTDSGGQYPGATTDVTRTISMGPLTEEEKKCFTLVAAGMLRLQNAAFIAGCTGRNLDILARQLLWEQGIDYKCGTGHGVGYYLNVHEGPHSIRWKYMEGSTEAVLQPGMLVTDEPGVYKEGQFGIRTENVLLVKEKEKTADGTFLSFEVLTFAPIDVDAIDISYLDPSDIRKLNEYHKQVYEKISPFLSEEEREWLCEITAEIRERV